MNKSSSKKFFIVLLTLLLGLAAGVGLYLLTSSKVKPHLSEHDMKSATLLKQSRPLQSFSLVDMNEKSFTQETLKGQWNLVFFGFTHCPSICPTALATLNQVFKKLEGMGLKKMPRVVFVSVDPERDHPKVLQKYLSHFNTQFLGVTGKEEQINRFAKDLGAVYMEVEGEGPDQEYTIDHSSAIFVVDPKGDFYALFSSPEKADEMAADIKKMIP